MLLLSNIDGQNRGKKVPIVKVYVLDSGYLESKIRIVLIIERKRNHNKHKRERDKERI